MAKDDLIKLPSFSYTALDFESIIDEIKRIISENPDYNQSWDDFLSSNAGKMILELIAYVVDALAYRVDWVANELYIGTATQKQSIINLLKLINYRLRLPTAAAVKVDATLSNWVEPFDLPALMSVTATDRDGNPATFELIKKDSDGEFIYFGEDAIVTIDTGSQSNPILEFTGNNALIFYEGATKIEEHTMDGIDNEYIVLENYPVIENSIQIWTLSGGGVEVEKLPLVDSFVDEKAQLKSDGSPLTVPPYMIEVDAESRVTVKFGSSSLVNTFNPGDEIRIYYRVGGGLKGNIVIGALTATKTFLVDGIPVTVTFKNNEAGAGGSEAEDVFEVRTRAPLYLTTADKTVTPLDYKRILLAHSNVLLAAAYGKANEPPEIKDEYGYTIPTYETWIYFVPNVDFTQYDPRTEYNIYLQPTKPYEIKTITATFPNLTPLTGTIDIDKNSKKIIGHNTLFSSELDKDDVIVIAGSGTGDEQFVGVIDYVESGSNTVLYLKDYPLFSAQNQNFAISTLKLQLPSEFIPIYKRYPAITIKNAVSGEVYLQGVDYTIDYDKGLITRYRRYAGYGIPDQTLLSIEWWWHDQTRAEISDITTIDNYLKNKKMLSIQNVYLDTLYTAFDIKGIVYVEKNYNQELVKDEVESLIFFNYKLDQRDYAQPVHISEIIALIQSVPGVRYVQIQYFGKDYATYKNDPVNPPSYAQNYGLGAIPAKYNEILIISNNEFEGNTISTEYQLHGVIFDYTEVVE